MYILAHIQKIRVKSYSGASVNTSIEVATVDRPIARQKEFGGNGLVVLCMMQQHSTQDWWFLHITLPDLVGTC